MPMVDLVDETFVVATPADLASRLHDPRLWRHWWPELNLTVFQDRGTRGIRWTVTGALVGSSEVWLEPWGDGVVVHYYLRADLTASGSATEPRPGRPARLARAARAVSRRHSAGVKRCLNALKDELEDGREAGTGRRQRG
jgi:hypothetical protein